MKTNSSSTRVSSLDFARGFAMLMVLGAHFRFSPNEAEGAASGFIWRLWKNVGWTGIDFFFVMSGFLIGGLLLDEYSRTKKVHVFRFLTRRGLKIYPGYFLLMGAALIWGHWNGWLSADLQRFVGYLFFIQNYSMFFPKVIFHTWSLAVEEHFYLVVTFLFFFLSRNQIKTRAVSTFFKYASLTALAACLLFRFDMSAQSPFAWTTHITPSHLRADALLFGLFLADRNQHDSVRFLDFCTKHRVSLGVIGLGLLMVPASLLSQSQMFTWGLTTNVLASGMALMSALGLRSLGKTGVSRAVARIGLDSYSIYLWHAFVQVGVGQLFLKLSLPEFGPAARTIYVAASLFVGIEFAKIIEHPMLRLRNRLYPSRGSVF